MEGSLKERERPERSERERTRNPTMPSWIRVRITNMDPDLDPGLHGQFWKKI